MHEIVDYVPISNFDVQRGFFVGQKIKLYDKKTFKVKCRGFLMNVGNNGKLTIKMFNKKVY